MVPQTVHFGRASNPCISGVTCNLGARYVPAVLARMLTEFVAQIFAWCQGIVEGIDDVTTAGYAVPYPGR